MANRFLDNYTRAEEEQSFFKKTGDFLQYGVTGSVVSAGTSLINTAIALGNFLGADGEKLDTEESINNLLGDNAAEYYSNNKTLVDTGGLVLGSIVPGTIAVKAGRLLAQGTLATKTTALATGIREAIVQEQRIKSWETLIKAKNLTKLNGAQRLKLVAQNLGQQAFEASLYEAATLATLNQNPILAEADMTAGEVGYFESVAKNLDTAAFGVAFGGVLGGSIGYLTNKGIINSAIAKTRAGVNELTRTSASGTNTIVGDEVTLKLRDLFNNKQKLRSLSEMSEVERSANKAQIKALESGILNGFNDVVELINKNSKGHPFGNYIVDALKEHERKLVTSGVAETSDVLADKLQELTALATKFSTLDPKDYSKAVTANVAADSALELPSLFVTKYPEYLYDEAQGIGRLVDDLANSPVGTAVNKNTENVDIFLQTAGHMKAQDIAALWRKRRIRVNYRNPMGDLMPNPQQIASKKGSKPPKYFSDLLDVQDSLAKLAYDFDPNFKLQVDAYNKGWDAFNELDTSLRKTLAKEQKVKVADVVLSKHNLPADYQKAAEFVGQQSQIFNDLMQPDNLLGVAYKVFNKAELDEKVIKSIDSYGGQYRLLYEWMNNNKLLKNKYGSVTAYADFTTGKLTNDLPVAGISDLGTVTVKPNAVSAGRETFVINSRFNPIEQSPLEASARHVWASSTSGGARELFNIKTGQLSKKWADVAYADDIPLLTTISKAPDRINWTVGLTLKVDDAGTITLNSPEELTAALRKAKATWVNKLASTKKPDGSDYTLAEVAKYIDADEEYVHAVQRGLANPWEYGEEFFTANKLVKTAADGTETIKPHHVKIDYSIDGYHPDTGKRLDSFVDIEQRKQAVQRIDDEYFQLITGENYDIFPDPTSMRNGSASFADDITELDETTTFFKAFQPNLFTGSSFVQSIGSSVRKLAVEDDKAIRSALAPAIEAIRNDKSAWQELSILSQSVLRNNKFTMLSDDMLTQLTAVDVMPTDIAGRLLNSTTAKQAGDITSDQIFKLVGIDKVAMFNATLDGLGINKVKNVIITQDGMVQLRKLFSELALSPDDLTAIKQQLLKSATNPEAFNGVVQELKLNLLTQARATMAEARLILSQKGGLDGKAFFEVQSDNVMDFLKQYHNVNVKYNVSNLNLLNQARGTGRLLDENVLYPGRFDAATYDHVAFVELLNTELDPWAVKSKGMLFGHSADALSSKIDLVRKHYGSRVKIITAQDTKNFLKARKAYDAEEGFTDLLTNSALAKEGKLFDLVPEPNINTANDMVNSLINQRRNIIRGAVKLRYAQEFATLEQLDAAATRFDSISNTVNKAEASQFRKHINQMLAITDADSYEWWDTIQETANKAISKGWHTLTGGFKRAAMSGDFTEFKALMDKYDMPKVYNDKVEDWILANATASKPVLQNTIAKINGLFSTTMLRLDGAQAIVNSMASPIMLTPELANLKHVIKHLDPDRLKKLNLILSAPIDESGRRMASNTKIQFQAIQNLFNKSSGYMDEYVRHGIVGDYIHELRQLTEGAAFDPKNVKGWMGKVNELVDKAATPVDWSERVAKFTAADSCRQVLDIMGVPKTHGLYWSTIKTFTSRVTGNYNAAQRPALFQGWAGQAVGLFQTYQFNLFQQFMKHIEDGNGAAKYMVGMQAGIFGAQSVPGFQVLNQYIGEKTLGEKDIYSVTSDSFDNPVADFLLYGAGSSAAKPLLGGKGIDFFNRGDLTPRTPIIIPSSFSEIPAVSFMSKLVGGLAGAYDQLSDGAPAGEVFLNALAHNGINRPLAGVAQLIAGEKTTMQGTTMIKYPELNYANVITKLLGTKTLNEGIALNAFYRSKAYRTNRLQELSDLGRIVKAKIRSQEGLNDGDMNWLMREYSSRGGNIATFRSWLLNNYSNAEDSNITKLYNEVTSVEGNYYQSVLGARIDEFSY